jgi:predicted TIM-barrel fold metal-dependent hydrolase
MAGIVDSHVHLLPDKLARKIRAFFDNHISRDIKLAYPLEHATVLESLHQAGVDTIWNLPYAHKSGVAAGMNLASAEIVAEQAAGPVAIVGGATVHPHDHDPAAIVKAGLENHGLRILKLHCSVGHFAADDPHLDPVWALVSERRVPVVVHTGHAVSGHTTAAELEPLERVARRFPAARIIIAHCGHQAGPEALQLVERYPAVYADLTPVVNEPVALPAEKVRQLAHKLLFGSDTPNVALSVPENLAHLKSFGLDAASEAAILGDNARRLLNEVIF